MGKMFCFLIKNHQILAGSARDAFLATVFGMWAQERINKRKDETEAEKITELVKNEMDLNYQLAKQMAITKEAVYEFRTDYYDKFLDKIMLIKNKDVKERILDIYIGLKLYNVGINSGYALIIKGIKELNEIADWKLETEPEEELVRIIDIYESKKARGEIIVAGLANYEGKDKRGYYGIIRNLEKIYEKMESLEPKRNG